MFYIKSNKGVLLEIFILLQKYPFVMILLTPILCKDQNITIWSLHTLSHIFMKISQVIDIHKV